MKEPPFVGRQQSIAPSDRGCQRPVARWNRPHAPVQESHAIVQVVQDLSGAEDADARGSQLDRQRDSVEPLAHLGNLTDQTIVELEADLGRPRSLSEKA